MDSRFPRNRYIVPQKDAGIIYESEVIDRLARYDNEGRGKILELCDIQFGDRTLPLVGFSSGNIAMLTARHHIGEAFGTDSTIYELIEDGVEGITAVPVVDAENYDNYQIMISEWFSDDVPEYAKGCPDWAASCVLDMIKGYKGNPFNSKLDWDFYKYGSPDAPERTLKIQELILKSKVFYDIHNDIRDFQFVTKKSGSPHHEKLQTVLMEQLKHWRNKVYEIRLESSSEDIVALDFNSHYYPITFAADNNIPNFAIETPAIYYGKDSFPRMWHIQILTNVNKAIIKSAVNELK